MVIVMATVSVLCKKQVAGAVAVALVGIVVSIVITVVIVVDSSSPCLHPFYMISRLASNPTPHMKTYVPRS